MALGQTFEQRISYKCPPPQQNPHHLFFPSVYITGETVRYGSVSNKALWRLTGGKSRKVSKHSSGVWCRANRPIDLQTHETSAARQNASEKRHMPDAAQDSWHKTKQTLCLWLEQANSATYIKTICCLPSEKKRKKKKIMPRVIPDNTLVGAKQVDGRSKPTGGRDATLQPPGGSICKLASKELQGCRNYSYKEKSWVLFPVKPLTSPPPDAP